MSRNTWTCQIKSGGSWTSDGTIFRPNDSISISKTSTQNQTALADGNIAYVTPSIKYRDGAVTFIWYWDDGTVKAKIEGYINGQNDVKIIDHNSREYVGRFLAINSQWIAGLDNDKYDIRATLEIMPSLA